jgi:hypothetical protein
MSIAEKYQKMINDSDEIWANCTCEVAASHVVNLALSFGEVAGIRLDGQTDPLLEFTDGSLIVFKMGNWVARGFYVQTQDGVA